MAERTEETGMNDATGRPWPYDGLEGRARLTGNACYPGPGECKATDFVHKGCGGTVMASLDGEFCGRCGGELREEDWTAVPATRAHPKTPLNETTTHQRGN